MVSGLDPGRVIAASAAWVFVPDTAESLETADYLLVRFPDWSDRLLQVLRFEPGDDIAATLGEVLARASATGLPAVAFWVKLGAPEVLAPMLEHLGGALVETLDVLALDLADGVPDLGTVDDVEVRWVDDVDALRDSYALLATVFGGEVPPPERLQVETWQTAADHDQGLGGAVVAYVGGDPVGTGGLSVVDGVGRLWSGSVLPEARGRGVYRALLAARLGYAAEHGCTLALVKGRVATSGPILRRAGFAPFGVERCYDVPLHA